MSRPRFPGLFSKFVVLGGFDANQTTVKRVPPGNRKIRSGIQHRKTTLNDSVRVQCVSGYAPDCCQIRQQQGLGVYAGINVDARFECRKFAAEDYETGIPCGSARFQLRRQNHAAEYRDDCSDRRSRGQCCRGECASVRSVCLHSPYRDVETHACDACLASGFLLGT